MEGWLAGSVRACALGKEGRGGAAAATALTTPAGDADAHHDALPGQVGVDQDMVGAARGRERRGVGRGAGAQRGEPGRQGRGDEEALCMHGAAVVLQPAAAELGWVCDEAGRRADWWGSE